MNKVFVTSTGCITAAGQNVQELKHGLINQASGIRKIQITDTRLRATHVAGEVPFTNQELAAKAGVQANKHTRTTLLGLIAAREAWQGSRLPKGMISGFISATTVGGMDRSELFYDNYLKNTHHNHLRDILHHDSAGSTEHIAKALNISHNITTISTACSSSANAIMLGARMIAHGLLDVAVVGGTDALCRFTLNGFNSLMILDKQPSQPFDNNRRGLNLGEGAAYLTLASEKALKYFDDKAIGEVSGYGNANDAHHQTASSPEGRGAFSAMKRALEHAGLSPQDIDYINAHGTGTPNNDSACSFALRKLYGDNVPHMSSTKPYTGHTLAAAGSVEAVISLLAISEEKVWPNLNFKEAIPETGIVPVTQLTNHYSKHVLSNSFGFGGNCTSLILSAIK